MNFRIRRDPMTGEEKFYCSDKCKLADTHVVPLWPYRLFSWLRSMRVPRRGHEAADTGLPQPGD